MSLLTVWEIKVWQLRVVIGLNHFPELKHDSNLDAQPKTLEALGLSRG